MSTQNQASERSTPKKRNKKTQTRAQQLKRITEVWKVARGLGRSARAYRKKQLEDVLWRIRELKDPTVLTDPYKRLVARNEIAAEVAQVAAKFQHFDDAYQRFAPNLAPPPNDINEAVWVHAILS